MCDIQLVLYAGIAREFPPQIRAQDVGATATSMRPRMDGVRLCAMTTSHRSTSAQPPGRGPRIQIIKTPVRAPRANAIMER